MVYDDEVVLFSVVFVGVVGYVLKEVGVFDFVVDVCVVVNG